MHSTVTQQSGNKKKIKIIQLDKKKKNLKTKFGKLLWELRDESVYHSLVRAVVLLLLLKFRGNLGLSSVDKTIVMHFFSYWL